MKEKKHKEVYIFHEKKMEIRVGIPLLMIFNSQKEKKQIYIEKKNKILHLQIIRYYSRVVLVPHVFMKITILQEIAGIRI
jgi:hypothetical protein